MQKIKYSKRFLFGLPIAIESGNFNDKLAFVKQCMRRNKHVRLKLKVNAGEIEVCSKDVRYIDIELTNSCNAACIFCPHQKMKTRGYMEENIFFSAIDKLRDSNVGKIMFIGRGEPLLHPKIFDYVRHVRENTGLGLEIFTNGYMLTPDVVDRLVSLNDDVLDLRINVSLHSFDISTHKKLVGIDFKTVAKNIRYLISKEDRLQYSVCFVKNKMNEHEMTELRKRFNGNGGGNLDISLIYNKGGHVNNDALFDEAFYSRAFRASGMNDIPAKKLCKYTYEHLSYFLNYKGDFVLCHDDFGDTFKLGSILDDEFDVIDEKIRKLKENGGTSQCKKCTKYLREFYHGDDKEAESLPARKIHL